MKKKFNLFLWLGNKNNNYIKIKIFAMVTKLKSQKLIFWGTFEELLFVKRYVKKIDWNDQACPQHSCNIIWSNIFEYEMVVAMKFFYVSKKCLTAFDKMNLFSTNSNKEWFYFVFTCKNSIFGFQNHFFHIFLCLDLPFFYL